MQNLYSIYDSDTEEFSIPFASKNDKTATKGFELDLYAVCEQTARLHKKPDVSIFTLFCIGAFDPDADMPVTTFDRPVMVYEGSKFDVSAFLEEVEAMQKEDDEVNNG